MPSAIPQNQDYLSPDSSELKFQNILKAQDTKDKNQGAPVNTLLLVFWVIYQTVITSHDTTASDAKRAENNGKSEMRLIGLEQGFAFSVLNSSILMAKAIKVFQGMAPGMLEYIEAHGNAQQIAEFKQEIVSAAPILNDVLNSVQMKNQGTSAARTIIEDKLNVSKQTATVYETDLNTDLNSTSQSISAGGSLASMLTNLTEQISSIVRS